MVVFFCDRDRVIFDRELQGPIKEMATQIDVPGVQSFIFHGDPNKVAKMLQE